MELLQRATALEEQGDPAGVVELLDDHRGSDHAELLYQLAFAYFQLATTGGREGEADPTASRRALDIGRRALELGKGEAASLLYLIHFHGVGVPHDVPLALGYLRQGADAGDPAARLNLLAIAYQGHAEAPPDLREACRLQALFDDSDATFPVVFHYRGMMLARGECGMEADVKAGFALIRRAAKAEVAEAQVLLGRALQHGWLGTPDAAAGLDWLERAAALGNAYGQWELGKAHATGELRARDDARAVSLFEAAAEAGLPEAHTSLAVMYATGSGVRQNFNQALTLYSEAVALGDSHALRNLAVMYALGEGTPPDPVLAKLYYLKHLHFGHPAVDTLSSRIDALLDPAGQSEVEARFNEWLQALPVAQ
ncbi:MAG: sel1 repeat family protein [Xanthomonadales bacterium]|nr:sel1 repeat family protein [Xanthomonadales bacterium]